MIIVTARFRVRPEDADRWPEIIREYTLDTRKEPGCVSFDWSRGLDDPTEYILVEFWKDEAANAAHLGTEQFQQAQRDLPPRLTETVQIVKTNASGWSPFTALTVSH
ncbi:putative quinol monooxygenase [Micromonospora sp. NPDC005174]|uniref:putative quinol monooxygenase n=1 Tax=unclassified Micromonospora TaxID=2617518 RepID=UPI0033A06FDD